MGRPQNKVAAPASPRRTGRRAGTRDAVARGEEDGEPADAVEEHKEEEEREEIVARRSGLKRTAVTRRRAADEEEDDRDSDAIGDAETDPKLEEEFSPPPKKKQSHGVASEGTSRGRSSSAKKPPIHGSAVFTNFFKPPVNESAVTYQMPESSSSGESWALEKTTTGKPLVFRPGWPKGEPSEFQTIDFDFQAASSRHDEIEFRSGLPKSIMKTIEAKQDAQQADAAAAASAAAALLHQHQQLAQQAQNSTHTSSNDRSAAPQSPTSAENGENAPGSPSGDTASSAGIPATNNAAMTWQEHVVTMTTDDSRSFQLSSSNSQNAQPVFVPVYPGDMGGLLGSNVLAVPTKFNFINMESPYIFTTTASANGGSKRRTNKDSSSSLNAVANAATSHVSTSSATSSSTNSHESPEMHQDNGESSVAPTMTLDEVEAMPAPAHVQIPLQPTSRGRRKSSIWQYFAQENGKQVCQHCPPERGANIGSFSLTTTTRTLRKHLKAHHPELDIPPVHGPGSTSVHAGILEE